MKIGLVGEAPNDTQAIKNLLLKKYKDLNFVFMLQRINGSQLDNQRTKHILRIEYQFQKPDIVIFIRDLDSILPNRTQLYKKKEYFTEFNSVVDKKGIHLLHIYELEALIVSDIMTFNSMFNVNINPVQNVMKLEEPKEYLKSFAKNYNESKNSDIFDLLDFETVKNNCLYFEEFILRFDKLLLKLNKN